MKNKTLDQAVKEQNGGTPDLIQLVRLGFFGEEVLAEMRTFPVGLMYQLRKAQVMALECLTPHSGKVVARVFRDGNLELEAETKVRWLDGGQPGGDRVSVQVGSIQEARITRIHRG